MHCKAASRGISIQSSCLSTAHECDRHTRRTEGHSCSSLELEAVGLRSISFLVPNLVEFSSRDLKVLIVSAYMTSCDKWFQFCSTQWLKIFLCRLSYCVARLKADLVRPVICHISFLVHSDAASSGNRPHWPHLVAKWTDYENIKEWKEKRTARPVGLPLGTGKASGAWTQNFCVSCHAVSKHEQKAVINMAASRPSRSEIIQVESS